MLVILLNNNDLEVCDNKCVNYNLFRFGTIDQCVPEFIYYKIELSNKFLYSNVKYQNYQIEKMHHLNDHNQFNVSIAINKTHWSKVNKEIKKTFWIITFFTLINILLLYTCSSCISSGYFSKYLCLRSKIFIIFSDRMMNNIHAFINDRTV